eukprot:535370-Rhodomonas_salina.1
MPTKTTLRAEVLHQRVAPARGSKSGREENVSASCSWVFLVRSKNSGMITLDGASVGGKGSNGKRGDGA